MQLPGGTGTVNFIGSIGRNIRLGNQTFSTTSPNLTLPNIIINNTNSSYGAYEYDYWNGNSTWSINNLTINSGCYFQTNNWQVNVAGNIINNGTIFVNGNWTSALINLNGTSQQTISGSGSWQQINSNAGLGIFPGLQISNTYGTAPQVLLNQSFALQNNLVLTSGSLSTTNNSKLTIGVGTGAYTMTTQVFAVPSPPQ